MTNVLTPFLRKRCSITQLLFACLVTALVAAQGCQSYSTGLQQSETRAEEVSAIAALRTVASAQRAYAMSNEGNFASFPELVEAGFLDARFEGSEPEMHGYVFKMETGDKQFNCHADPAATTETGRHYYIDSSSAVIRVNPSRPATSDDPLLQQ